MKTKECLIKKKEIIEELRDMFSNATERTYDNVSHSYDKSGKSFNFFIFLFFTPFEPDLAGIKAQNSLSNFTVYHLLLIVCLT